MDLLVKFGIDYKLLLAQIFNFLILLGILYKLVYKPVLETLDKRSQKIEKSLKDAEQIEEKVQAIEKERQEAIIAAKQEAAEILNKVNEEANKQKQALEVKAQENVDKIVADAKKQIEFQKNEMIKGVKQEVADLVIEAVQKVIGKNIDKNDQQLIEQTINELKK